VKLSIAITPSSHRRSKLSSEKTTSADNLTLGSPTSKLERKSSGLLKSELQDGIEVSWFEGIVIPAIDVKCGLS
jgi:hypothetical protein